MASTIEQHGEEEIGIVGSLVVAKVNLLLKQIQEERIESIKEKLYRNRRNLQCQISEVMTIISTRDSLQTDENTIQRLSFKINHPLYKFGGISQGLGEKECINNRNIKFSTSIKIPFIESLPPFTFWIHLTRNQKMPEEQSVIGKKQIYYDKHGGETLIYNDSDKESTEFDDVKRDFSVAEDQILWMTFEEHGFSKEVLNIVSKFVRGTILEIQERYKYLKEKNTRRLDQHSKDSGEHESLIGISLDKSLNDALDTFDSLFCRQCIQIFDCPLHGCSQPIYPCEKQKVWSELEGDRKPCSDHCYLQKPLEAQVDEKLSFSDWKPLEKELYLKGVEIFGRNSCLIARNLLSGLKTCMEVASYMYDGEVSVPDSSIMNKNGQIDAECRDREIASGSRLLRKRRKTRKFKYSSKSAGLPSTWKRITAGKSETYKQYTPCGCQGMCGKQCSCLQNGSCCEKYCGCSKLCKNRFRGCHCAKSQCRSRQCPCFAAERECDPDVCRNCWVSCGGGSLGEPPRRGDSQCGNMRLLLRQKQRILLAKSDIAGWGAFLKNPANKNDYLGEYTGELISHLEAEKRGKIYDRVNSSFLFNLNDQYVLDAYRKGDKLKFANHSAKPNCYARIMLVGGDHRVGIFAKERIEAGEELFYDYCYGPEQAPAWF